MGLSTLIKNAGLASLVSLAMAAIGGCEKEADNDSAAPIRSFENQVDTRFTQIGSLSFRAPDVSSIPFSYDPAANAIWGAIGRDDNGNFYLGTSTRTGSESTVFFYQYDPETSSKKTG